MLLLTRRLMCSVKLAVFSCPWTEGEGQAYFHSHEFPVPLFHVQTNGPRASWGRDFICIYELSFQNVCLPSHTTPTIYSNLYHALCRGPKTRHKGQTKIKLKICLPWPQGLCHLNGRGGLIISSLLPCPPLLHINFHCTAYFTRYFHVY